MKREGVRTLFIRSYLQDLNRFAHFLKIALCRVFENILKSCQCKVKHCNDFRISPREWVQSVCLKIF